MTDDQPDKPARTFWGQSSPGTRGGQWKPVYASRMDQGRDEAARRYPTTTTDRKA